MNFTQTAPLCPPNVSSPPLHEERPLVLFHLPRKYFDQFFDPADMLKYEHLFRYAIPPSDNPNELLNQWNEVAPAASAVVTGWDSPPITNPMLDVAPNLAAIVHSAGSVRFLIPPLFWDRDIRVATANDVLGRGVAETTLGYILAGLKGFFPLAREMREPGGKWQDCIGLSGLTRVRELFRVTIGIIGASRTGRHLSRLLQPFDVKLLLSDPTIDADEAESLGCEFVELEELFSHSDVVSLHAPPLPPLRKMIGSRLLKMMKQDAIFINTARGMLVDEAALIAELETGKISAILDVTYPEPPDADSPFRRLPNVVLLPHIAGAIANGCLRQGADTLSQLVEWKMGLPMHGEISAERISVMA